MKKIIIILLHLSLIIEGGEFIKTEQQLFDEEFTTVEYGGVTVHYHSSVEIKSYISNKIIEDYEYYLLTRKN